MAKTRVYELAKELNVPTKEMMKVIGDLKLDIKSHMSMVAEKEIQAIKEAMGQKAKNKAKGAKGGERSPRDSQSREGKRSQAAESKTRGQTKEGSSKESSKSHSKKDEAQSPGKNEEKKASKDSQSKKNSRENQGKKDNREKPSSGKNKKSASKDRRQQSKGNLGKSKGQNRGQDNRSRNKNSQPEKKVSEKKVEPIEIEDSVLVNDLATKLEVPVNAVITQLIQLGIMASQNQEVDYDTAQIIAEEFDRTVVKKKTAEEEIDDLFDMDFEDDPKDLKKRPPVITVMGHVDHGKTSLLDAIRNTHVTRSEAGGITQHIGAHKVQVNGETIVFLDTPGHEAFTAMRSRGAQVTDLAILVVAADDGVMPQTIEAINHAKAAEVPIIVAINKMDRPDANVERIKQELAEHGLMPDDWGGDAITVPISALQNQGIDDLLEMVLMVSEMEELKANPKRPAIGTIIEAQLDRGRGPTATVLVEKGTLSAGDIVVSGSAYGRVRAMFDDKGKGIKKAGPSHPALILGLSEVPEAGEKIYVVEDEKAARQLAEKVKSHLREEMIKPSEKISLDDLFGKISEGELKTLNIVIKTDVRGTIDAVKNSLEKLSNDEVRVDIIHGGVGGITESDVMLAAASNAIVIGFNVRPTQGAMDLAKHESVDVRSYRVIYDAIEDIKKAISGMLAPTLVEEVLGRCEVRATFKVPGGATVAGVYVQNGKITRQSTVRLIRNDTIVHEGPISSLKRFKDDVRELNTGYEGGVGLENYNDIKEGDVFEAFIMKEVKNEK